MCEPHLRDMMNEYLVQRDSMVEGQIRRRGVENRRVLEAMKKVGSVVNCPRR